MRMTYAEFKCFKFSQLLDSEIYAHIRKSVYSTKRRYKNKFCARRKIAFNDLSANVDDFIHLGQIYQHEWKQRKG